jgi:Bacterial Ig-like domain (group 1)
VRQVVRTLRLPIVIKLRSSGWRSWRRLQAGGLALLAIAAVAIGVVGIAGAAAPTEGSIVPNSAVPTGTFTKGTPFSSGQNIDVVVPANSVFTNPNQNVNILECSAPNGVPPISSASCDGNTINGNTMTPNVDGSLDYLASTGLPFTIYALPDKKNLGEGTGGTACGNTPATECILYIGVDQLDFTQPHVWSQPFGIVANGDDLGENPGDGTLTAPPSAASAAESSVIASPATAVADGQDSSTVTVTLLGDTGSSTGLPVPGKTVTLTGSTPNTTITPAASPNVTGANGQATFTVTDTTAEAVTYTASDMTDGIAPNSSTNQPSVTFAAPVVGTVHSTVLASPISVLTAGDPTTITVTLRDQAANPEPVAGKTVSLVGAGSAVITPATPGSAVTDASGVATFTATDTASESVTFTASDVTDGITLTSTTSVTFGTLVVSPTTSTISASSPAEVGVAEGSKVVVTLLTSGNEPVAGRMVTLSFGSSSAMTSDPNPATTDSSGKASFVVTDATPETVNLTAEDTTDSVTLKPTTPATVSFQPAAPSAATSTVLAQSATSIADGQTTSEIIVTVKDQFGNPLSGKVVHLVPDSGSSALVHPIAIGNLTPGTTDSTGAADFVSIDSVAEAVTYTATDTSDNSLVLTQTAMITYQAGDAAATSRFSTVVASNANPPSDGSTASTITVTLTDILGNPVSGKTTALKALSGNSTITTVRATTNNQGEATFTVVDGTAEVVSYQATDVTDSNTVFPQEATVTFGNPPAPPPVSTFCSVVVTPSTVAADGTTSATVSVLLYDGNGDAVGGKTVTLTATAGQSTITTVKGTSDSTGNALFTVTDSTAESVTYTADDTTDSVNLTALPVSVTFTASTGSATTTTTTPGGSTTTTGGSTTTTTSPSTTTTSAGGSTTTSLPQTSPSSSDSGSNGSTSSGTGSGSLAFTGVSAFLPWLAGIGAALLAIGTIGRRRFKAAA